MKKITRTTFELCLAGAIAVASSYAVAQELPARPAFGEDGTVQVPAFALPPSEFISAEALDQLKARAAQPTIVPTQEMDIATARAGLEAAMAPKVADMLERYPVDIEAQEIAGIPTRVLTPTDREPDPDRVLINLHGGAYTVCADACPVLESAPIAALGGFRVVTVDYRMAPEAKHPAGVEDVAAVYRELLKSYQPEQIGIYGCSAGGNLTAQAAAWLPAHALPQAGAVGIFGAGGVRFGAGDSAYIAAYIDGSFPAPAKAGEQELDMTRGYFDGVDMKDPIVAPALHPEVMARFPPTLIITGTRAMDMSPAIFTNSRLIKAGISSTLIVEEGMGHCYMYSPELPEAQDAFQATVNFFRAHLGERDESVN